MSIRFIHTGDIHIGMSFSKASFGYAVGLKRREEIKSTFFRILDECIHNNVQLLLLTGDLFEEDYITVSELKDIRNKFASMPDTRIFITAGNHDPIINQRSGYNLVEWSSNVHIFSTLMEHVVIEELNVVVYGFSWSTKEIKEYGFDFLQIEDTSKFNILMLHGDAYSDSPYLPLNMNELFGKGFDYIALGHIHKPDEDQYRWAYPGSPEPLDFSETGVHGFIEGIIDGESLNVQFKPFAKREFIHKSYKINEVMSFEEIKNMIQEDIFNDDRPEALYRIKINGVRDIDVKINLNYIKEAIESQVFYAELSDHTIENYDLERIKRDNQDNIIERFVLLMEEKGIENQVVKDALYEGLDILLKEQVS